MTTTNIIVSLYFPLSVLILIILPFLQQHVAVVREIPEHHIVQVQVESTKLVDEQQSYGISCVHRPVVALGKDGGVEKVF